MENKALDPRKKAELVLKKETGTDQLPAKLTVYYEPADATHYSFSCVTEQGCSVHMSESDAASENSDFKEVIFDDAVSDKERVYYQIAAASGVLTGAMSSLKLNFNRLENEQEKKNRDWSKYVIAAARLAGYKKNDYKGAVRFITKRAVTTVKENGAAFTDSLLKHPTLVGFVFSILTQFGREEYYLDEREQIKTRKLPEYYAIGRDTAEKILFALVYWVLNLAAESSVSTRPILNDIRIQKNLLLAIKELSESPFIKSIPDNFEEAEKAISDWLRILFSDDEDGDDGHVGMLKRVMNQVKDAVDQSPMVILNECIFRGFYFLRRVGIIAKERDIRSFDQLKSIDPSEILPFNNRIVANMSVIASASFAAVDAAGAALRVLMKEKRDGETIASALFAEINLAGLGRFAFAIGEDCRYWAENTRVIFERSGKQTEKQTNPDEGPDACFDALILDALQARFLYSLEALEIQYDIAHTKNAKDIPIKKKWLSEWKRLILSGVGCPDDSYFIQNEDGLYKDLYEMAQDPECRFRFYLLAEELGLFNPYFPLGGESDKNYRHLKENKKEADYVAERFIRKQTVVSQDELEQIRTQYKHYSGIVSGKTRGTTLGAGAAAITAVAAGAFAAVFAPQIAVLLAGEAVAGLHGVALTNASLALVGGGALAAGGLGMAGGSAIITGGGALLGLLGTGSVSAAAVVLQIPTEYWVRQGAKLLIMCELIASGKFGSKESLPQIGNRIKATMSELKANIAEMESEKSDLNKEFIRKSKAYLKVLQRVSEELEALCEGN